MAVATHLHKEEIRNLILEVMQEELGYDKLKYLNILERLTRLEEGQKRLLERFEDMHEHMDKRFEDVDKRFEDMNKRFTMLTTFMTIGFSGLAILIALLKFFA
jgi:hypothetical protein